MDKRYVRGILEDYIGHLLLPNQGVADCLVDEKSESKGERKPESPKDDIPLSAKKHNEKLIPTDIVKTSKEKNSTTSASSLKEGGQPASSPLTDYSESLDKAKPTADFLDAPIPKIVNPINLSDTASEPYQQHKQRLEKMLNQVNQLNTAEDQKPQSLLPANVPASDLESSEASDSMEELLETPTISSPALSSEWLENGRPNWAQSAFDILLIEVNGLKLAVPLIALGQIQTIDTLTPLFGQSEWFMGLQKSPIGNIKTVNTGKFVMPERYIEETTYQYVVSINGLDWGLAVDAIDQPIEIQPDAIRWRKNRQNKMWMAGTVKDHMCVLLDIPAMGDILRQEDQNHSSEAGR